MGEVIERVSKDLFALLYIHYNYISIFERQSRYLYRPLNMIWGEEFTLKFEIVDTEEGIVQYGETDFMKDFKELYLVN